MPVPMVAPAGPSIAQQLDEVLSAAQVPPTAPSDLLRIQPFLYHPTDRGARATKLVANMNQKVGCGHVTVSNYFRYL